jgi:hypothetical protein
MRRTKAELEAENRLLRQQLLESANQIRFYEQHHKFCRTALPDHHHDEASPTATPLLTHQHGEASPTTARPPPDRQHDEASPTTARSPPNHRHGEASPTTATQVLLTYHHYETSVRPIFEQPLTSKQGSTNTTTSIQDASAGQAPGTQKRKQWEITSQGLLDKIKKPRRGLLTVSSCNDGLIVAIMYGTYCDIQTLFTSPIMDPIAAARRYANITRDSREKAKAASRLASFQDLVFHSMCAVLEYCGYAIKDIDDIMRIRYGDLSQKHLKRLRDGALWANRVISAMTGGEWTNLSSRISGLFFECEHSPQLLKSKLTLER